MKICSWILLVMLMPLSSLLRAQAACPPGTIPYGTGNDPSACGPDNSQQQQAQPQQPALPPPQWATRWGAIATDGPGGHLGAVTGLKSKSDAQSLAIADCQAKGGLQCEVEVAYDNECAAMVLGHREHSSNAAATSAEAISLGMKICANAGDTNCHVYYSACSPPVRIR
jgi:hypothetical protein